MDTEVAIPGKVAEFEGDDAEVTLSPEEHLLSVTREKGDQSENSSVEVNMQEDEGTEFAVLPGQKNIEAKGMKIISSFI